MAVSWPTAGATAVPYMPLRDSFNIQSLGSPLLSSQMQSGRIRSRRQFTQSAATIQQTISMTEAQLANFNLLMGSSYDFSVDVWMPVFRPSTGAYTTYLCTIQGGANAIQVKGRGYGRYDVTFTFLAYGYRV